MALLGVRIFTGHDGPHILAQSQLGFPVLSSQQDYFLIGQQTPCFLSVHGYNVGDLCVTQINNFAIVATEARKPSKHVKCFYGRTIW